MAIRADDRASCCDWKRRNARSNPLNVPLSSSSHDAARANPSQAAADSSFLRWRFESWGVNHNCLTLFGVNRFVAVSYGFGARAGTTIVPFAFFDQMEQFQRYFKSIGHGRRAFTERLVPKKKISEADAPHPEVRDKRRLTLAPSGPAERR